VEPKTTRCWKCGHDPSTKALTRAERRKAATKSKRGSRSNTGSVMTNTRSGSARPAGHRSTIILVVGILVLGLAGGGYASVRYDWFGRTGTHKVTEYGDGKGGAKYTSKAGGFTATYPTRPTDFETIKNINDEDVEVRGAESQPGTDYRFVAMTTDVADTGSLQFLSPQDAFVEFAKEFALGGNGQIVGLDQDPIVISGTSYVGVDARIANHGKSVRVRGIVAGSTWYLVLMTEPTKKDNPDAFNRFVTSFQLTP
jgi:hypothetical protein